ncbi:hypothetical protein [Streptomyces sp. NBC_01601]|uniref:hypothetical protein n=1 Tax=Streptomyces sp. NBC_01601 TaxID=2975892 RepID=UPI002E2E8337|nr:hypothetical protein [Streptomyces sp. NBC_01601]
MSPGAGERRAGASWGAVRGVSDAGVLVRATVSGAAWAGSPVGAESVLVRRWTRASGGDAGVGASEGVRPTGALVTSGCGVPNNGV